MQGWFAPRLDNAARSGLQSWSVDDIVEYLQSGRNGRSHAGGLMAKVVLNSISLMSDADVHAIAVYLKDLPPGERECLNFILDDMGWDGYLGFIQVTGDTLHIGCSPASRKFFAKVFQEALEAQR